MDQGSVRGGKWLASYLRVVVQHQAASRVAGLAAVTGDTTSLKDRFDIAVILDIQDSLDEAQSGLIVDIPLLAGLIFLLGRQQGSALCEVEGDIVRLAGR